MGGPPNVCGTTEGSADGASGSAGNGSGTLKVGGTCCTPVACDPAGGGAAILS